MLCYRINLLIQLLAIRIKLEDLMTNFDCIVAINVQIFIIPKKTIRFKPVICVVRHQISVNDRIKIHFFVQVIRSSCCCMTVDEHVDLVMRLIRS